MSTFNSPAKSYTNLKNLNLKGGVLGTGLIRWMAPVTGATTLWASNPFSSNDYGLYLNASGNLAFSSLGNITVLDSLGGQGISTTASLGTVQSSTPTAAQLLGGIVTQTGATGAGTVTLPTGTELSTAVPGVTVGYTFTTTFVNLGGAQTLTITGATGSTVIGTVAVATGKSAILTFVNTGTNTWNVYTSVSA